MSVNTRIAKALAALLLACVLTGLTGCRAAEDPRKAQLQTHLNALRAETAEAQEAVNRQGDLLQSLEQRLRAGQQELAEYNSSVDAYMLQHKMAVAALVAGVAGAVPWLEEDGKFSQDAKELGAALTMLAALWAVTHMDEVSEVLGTLNEADVHARNLQAAIDQTAEAVSQQQGNLRQAQARFAAASGEADSVKVQLARL